MQAPRGNSTVFPEGTRYVTCRGPWVEGPYEAKSGTPSPRFPALTLGNIRGASRTRHRMILAAIKDTLHFRIRLDRSAEPPSPGNPRSAIHYFARRGISRIAPIEPIGSESLWPIRRLINISGILVNASEPGGGNGMGLGCTGDRRRQGDGDGVPSPRCSGVSVTRSHRGT